MSDSVLSYDNNFQASDDETCLPDKVFKLNWQIRSITCQMNQRKHTLYRPKKKDSCLNLRTSAIIRVEESEKWNLVPALLCALEDLEALDGKIVEVDGWRILVVLRSVLWDEKMEALMKGVRQSHYSSSFLRFHFPFSR